MTVFKDFAAGRCVVDTPHAEATLSAFAASRERLAAHFEQILSAPERALEGAERFKRSAVQYFEIVEGADGVKFEAGFDVTSAEDGARELRLKILRVLGD